MKKSFDFWKELPRPLLVLAPMSGYTESPFRRLIKEIEPTTLLVSELISCKALIHGNEKTRRLIAYAPEEKNYYSVQLFGSEASDFIESTKILEDFGVDGIDLNLGCPSPKVVGSGHGSALLRDPCTTARMIEKLVQSTHLPVSVKMRLGFYDDSLLMQTVKDFENAGISSLAIHGRTTKQKYTGQANWEPIYAVKDILNIPVIGNGDITSAKIAVEKIKHLDGVMIGRAAMRNPWIFKQVREAFDGKEISKKPPIEDQIEFFRKQADLSIDYMNERWAMLEMRKHFAHFVRGVKHAATYRERLIRVSTKVEMDEIFDDILRDSAAAKKN